MIIETQKLTEAIAFAKSITEGKLPQSGKGWDDFLNDPQIIRNMYFILSILNEIDSGNLVSKNRSPFPFEILGQFRYEQDMGIKNLLARIYAPVARDNVKVLTPQMVGNWLKDHGYINMKYDTEYMANVAVPTPDGEKIGLYQRIRLYQGRRFPQVIYSQPAQEFIVEHFREIYESSRVK
ncbi:MAG: hypothetical protein Q4E54_04350 [Lachnospiraceae bacterium]|nr:hypothetical protein [Lachnospiraceae bacterium]